MSTEDENSHLNDIEKAYIQSVKKGSLAETKQLIGQVQVDCCEHNGMTALMQACYKGDVERVEYLLLNGANPNIDTHTDKYTPLMFAALSGSTDTCRLLLQAGAKTDAINSIKRTAAQLGAFVGRHDCVSVINNFVQLEQIQYHTRLHGLDKQPKLKENLAVSIHQFVVIPNLHPIKAILYLEKNMELVENQKAVSGVLEFECQKAYKDVNEVFSLKVHIFNCILKKCHAWETNKEGKGGIKGLLKHMVKGRESDGFQMAVEDMLRGSLKSFPHSSSNVLQQAVKTLSLVTPGHSPSALSVLTQSINGVQSADFSECCSCCGTRHSQNKCSNCKMVRYCNGSCQKLHWSNHKKLCKSLKLQYDLLQAEEKRNKEEDEKRKLEEEKLKQEANTDAKKQEINVDNEANSKIEVDALDR